MRGHIQPKFESNTYQLPTFDGIDKLVPDSE
uniref:TarM n=1 Tax=Siphoviridae sp. ctnPP24 TaxID=2825662 RepID=A0A8S5TZ63_9CAUD|nr:MAG TPA: TarM [Siphoviridae sp. ctnPP24]